MRMRMHRNPNPNPNPNPNLGSAAGLRAICGRKLRSAALLGPREDKSAEWTGMQDRGSGAQECRSTGVQDRSTGVQEPSNPPFEPFGRASNPPFGRAWHYRHTTPCGCCN